jgi:membrane-associated phospholipid phosphatase
MIISPGFRTWAILCFSFLTLLTALQFYLGKPYAFVLMQRALPLPVNILKVITLLGDGIVAVGIVLYLGIRKKSGLAVSILLVWTIGAGFVQGLKHTLYKERVRPVEWFKQKNLPLAIPDGHEPHRTHSFPSGHTATAFGIWGMMAFYTHRRRFALAFAFLAILAAWSRIALFQHFPSDVVAGGLIGTCSIFAAIGLARRLEQKYPQLRNKH